MMKAALQPQTLRAEGGLLAPRHSAETIKTASRPAPDQQWLPIVADVLQSSGQPLDQATQEHFAQRFAYEFSHVRLTATPQRISPSKFSVSHPVDQQEQEADRVAALMMKKEPPQNPLSSSRESGFSDYDLSRVRVHTDARAAESAQAMQSLAYTVGDHLVFGAAQYQPQTPVGQRLLAHELTHVIQQRATGQPLIARQAVEQYETKGFIFDRQNIADVTKQGYWIRLILDNYELVSTPYRFNDPEEKDAVLSILWRNRPKGEVTTLEYQEVSIPPRSGAKDSKPLLYRFTYSPKDPGKPDAKDKLNIEFIAAGEPGGPVTLKAAPAAYKPSTGFGGYNDFPDNDPVKYFKAHPEEEKALLWWVEFKAPDTFSQIVNTVIITKQKNAVYINDHWFKVDGVKDKNHKVTGLGLTYLTVGTPSPEAAAAGYQAKDAGDALLEDAQTKPHAKLNDKLGTVTIPASVPADERVAVKYAVSRYFVIIGTRNAEVDAIVPMPNKTTSVFYSLRFRPNNDVDVERIGEQGKDAKAGQIDENKMDVARAPEYADKSKDVTTLSSWLKARYPKVTITGKTVDELRDNINKEAEAKADQPAWFDNYSLTILDATKGETRLKSVHKYKKERVKDMKDFLPKELKLLELMLEKMTRKILDLIKFISITRQRVAIDEDKSTKTFIEKPDIGGRTQTGSGKKTIIIFDSGIRGQETQFLGGKEGVLPEDVFIFGHELGHVVGDTGAQKKFNAFVKQKNIKAFTHYSQKTDPGPEKEFFPEALALFETDPEWMRSNYPELYTWFETLVKTGKAP